MGPTSRGIASLVASATLGLVLALQPAPEAKVRPAAPVRRPAAAPAIPVGEPPNVLIILTDDQRRDSMDVMDATRAWFERDGLRYTNAVTTTPLCCPARAGIMTGRYAHNHRVTSNYTSHLLDQRSTLQRYLQEAGYWTGIAGKYLNNWPRRAAPPFFDRWAIFTQVGYYDAPFNTNGKQRTISEYSTDYIARKSVRMLEEFETDDDRPWYLYVSPLAPHPPYEPARRYAKTPVPPWEPAPSVAERDLSDKPAFVRRTHGSVPLGEVKRARARQIRTLYSADDLVDRVMNAVEDLGEERDTLAVFVSDNGFFWHEHGMFDKRLPYREALEVPLYLRWPGVLPAGASDDRLAANIDLAPTILEVAGVRSDVERPMDGMSLLAPAERDRVLIEYWREERLFSDYPDWAGYYSPDEQYVEYYDDDGDVGVSEFYDLLADPFQLTNLLGDDDRGNDVDTATLSDELARDRRCRGAACP